MIEGYSEEEKNSIENLTFFYNREERLKNAPKIVQDFYAGKMTPPRGIFKMLVATKFNRFMLFTVALCFVVVLIVSFFSKRPSLAVCAGFECELSAFSFGDEIFSEIKVHPLKKTLQDKTQKKKIEDAILKNEAAVATFSFLDEEQNPFSKTQKSVPLSKDAFFLRTTFSDYDIIEVHAQVEIFGEKIELKASVKKRE